MVKGSGLVKVCEIICIHQYGMLSQQSQCIDFVKRKGDIYVMLFFNGSLAPVRLMTRRDSLIRRLDSPNTVLACP